MHSRWIASHATLDEELKTQWYGYPIGVHWTLSAITVWRLVDAASHEHYKIDCNFPLNSFWCCWCCIVYHWHGWCFMLRRDNTTQHSYIHDNDLCILLARAINCLDAVRSHYRWSRIAIVSCPFFRNIFSFNSETRWFYQFIRSTKCSTFM